MAEIKDHVYETGLDLGVRGLTLTVDWLTKLQAPKLQILEYIRGKKMRGPENLATADFLEVRNFWWTFLGEKCLANIFLRIFMGRRMDFLG